MKQILIIIILFSSFSLLKAEGDITRISVPPSPPPKDYKQIEFVKLRSDVIIQDIPIYDWSYGCVPTAGAMMAAYYDRNGYSKIYIGSMNNGVAPSTNISWGSGECPISASHLGIDGRTTKGHVDDYYIDVNNNSSDPYQTGNWSEHTPQDCLADFSGTSQNKWNNSDGYTTFHFYDDNKPLENYTGGEVDSYLDGIHGFRDYFESKGYQITTNYNQNIYGNNDVNDGFTFNNYMNEINNNNPVLIHITGHTMLGVGYNSSTNEVIVHDTWGYEQKRFVWGEEYAGRQHFGVSVIHLKSSEPILSIMETPGIVNSLTINLDIPDYLNETIVSLIDGESFILVVKEQNSFIGKIILSENQLDDGILFSIQIGGKIFNYNYLNGILKLNN